MPALTRTLYRTLAGRYWFDSGLRAGTDDNEFYAIESVTGERYGATPFGMSDKMANHIRGARVIGTFACAWDACAFLDLEHACK